MTVEGGDQRGRMLEAGICDVGVGKGEETALLEQKGARTEAVNKSPPKLCSNEPRVRNMHYVTWFPWVTFGSSIARSTGSGLLRVQSGVSWGCTHLTA